MDPLPDEEQAELIRKRHLYRRLILTRKVALPRAAATRLIGPDCAYHLYGQLKTTNPSDESTDKESAEPERKEIRELKVNTPRGHPHG